jgi:hypothetical protein
VYVQYVFCGVRQRQGDDSFLGTAQQILFCLFETQNYSHCCKSLVYCVDIGEHP